MEFLPIESAGNKVYAGFWKRFAAGIIDFLLFIPFLRLLTMVESISISITMVAVAITYLLPSLYTIYFTYRFGATLGKLALSIQIARPDGSKIRLREALLRSSVDLVFAILAVIAQVIAVSNADPERFLSEGWIVRAQLIAALFPAWYAFVTVGSNVWYWSEFIALLCNRRRRAIHDFIAGTVVIHKRFAEPMPSPDWL